MLLLIFLVNSDVAWLCSKWEIKILDKKPTVSLTKITGLSTLISGHKNRVINKF